MVGLKNKITDYKIDDNVHFLFLGTDHFGKVVLVDKDNLKVVDKKGIFYRVFNSEKESKFCYLA